MHVEQDAAAARENTRVSVCTSFKSLCEKYTLIAHPDVEATFASLLFSWLKQLLAVQRLWVSSEGGTSLSATARPCQVRAMSEAVAGHEGPSVVEEVAKQQTVTGREAPAQEVAKQESSPEHVQDPADAAAAVEQLAVVPVEEFRCSTCHRLVDQENTVVVNRQTVKSKETRRCKACHNLKAAVSRMQKMHGNLVQDFQEVTGPKLEAFYRDHSHLRGEDLRLRLQEIVTDWKQTTSEISFTGTGDYVDKETLTEKFKDRPDQLQNVLQNSHSFYDHVRGTRLFEDVTYTREAKDSVVKGTCSKRKGQLQVHGQADPLAEEQPSGSGAKKGKKGPPQTGNEDLPALKAAQVKKLKKKSEALNLTRLTCLDLVDKGKNQFKGMVLQYVLDATAAGRCPGQAEGQVRRPLQGG